MQSKPVSLLFAVVATCLLNIVGLYWSRLSHDRSEDSRVLTRQLSLWQWDDHDREGTEQQQQGIRQSQSQVSEISHQHSGQTTESQEDSMIVREANMGVDKKETEAWVSEGTDSESEIERTANLTDGVEEAYDASVKYKSTRKVVDTSKHLQGSQVEEKLVQNTTVSEKERPNLEVSVFASSNAGNFNLPVPFATLLQGQLLQVKWIQELRDYLNTVTPDSGPVTIVSSDYSYREILLNWLISALVRVDRPLSNVLVLSLDSSLHALLQGKGFACIHVPPDQLLRSVVINRLALTGHVAFTQVHILRLTVMRLVNHWGYDVANYDTDAIILKNPEPLYYKQYQDSDFIGSYGHSPLDIKQEWGIAICIGAMMIRSSNNTGMRFYLFCAQVTLIFIYMQRACLVSHSSEGTSLLD